MTIFAILMPSPQPALAEAIQREFPEDHLCITDTQWLVSSDQTVIEVTARIGIFDRSNPKAQSIGNAIVFVVSSYFGRAPTTVWDWIRAKLEGASRG